MEPLYNCKMSTFHISTLREVLLSACLSVCLSVGLSALLTYLKNHMSKLHKLFCTMLNVAVAWSSANDSVIYTSSFVDDVRFSHSGQYGA